MKTADIRNTFLRFFADKGHRVVESSSLVPGNDPTLMFTNSGMVQFKDVFLGFDKPSYATATTSQRCMRAGGKHNDLENVGYTARHHTFFEMLGNFSFGEYFKEKAIPYAWELLTSPDYLGIDRRHLWVTVFGGGDLFKDGAGVPADEQAEQLWLETLTGAGFSAAEAKTRITRIPSTDNFWMMGDTGPCGPCSEIFYDKDASVTRFRGEDEAYADICVEIWNLVFMQYNREDGALKPLPRPCVDTGMGLERISAVMQGVDSNYDIDLFADLLAAVAAMARDKTIAPSHRVIADHLRAAAFLVADGVLPANDGRGYVLRRIIRRALRHVHNIGGDGKFHTLAQPLAKIMGEAHPLIVSRASAITEALKREEESFSDMLKNGIALLQSSIKALPAGARELPGDVAFRLYDTFGFPPDMTATIARDEYNLTVDEAGFDACMKQQRERSRAATKFNINKKTITFDGAASEFIGYTHTQSEANIIAMFAGEDGKEQAKTISAGDEALVILDKTPFYGESGGQVGDTGMLTTADGNAVARVVDTQKIRADVWGHVVEVQEGALTTGLNVQCEVDGERRRQIARAHSAAHLMHAALRQLLGKHVEQRGSYVSPDSVRFDFSHNSAMTASELREVEALTNAQATENAEVTTEVMSYDDALKTGAMALFGEKYGDRVRVVTIDPAFSVELCGGTHVERAGDIGLFQFTGETAIAAGIRRVEALTADAALRRAQAQLARLSEIAALLKTPADRIEEKVAQLREQIKTLQQQVEQAAADALAQQAAALAQQAEEINGMRVLAQHIGAADAKALRRLAQELQQRLAPAAVFLSADTGAGKMAFAATVSKGRGVSARDWLAAATAIAGGRGGGKDDFAQSGGGDAGKRDDALTAARDFIQNAAREFTQQQ